LSGIPAAFLVGWTMNTFNVRPPVGDGRPLFSQAFLVILPLYLGSPPLYRSFRIGSIFRIVSIFFRFRIPENGVMFIGKISLRDSPTAIAPNDFVSKILITKDFIASYLEIMPCMDATMQIK
jgi:hypothetical protein